jgi:hypothetical protein
LLNSPKRSAAFAAAAVRCPVAAIVGTAKLFWISLAAASPIAAVCEANIDQGQIRALTSDQFDKFLRRAREAHHNMAERRQLAAEMLRDKVVVGNGDAQWLHQVLPAEKTPAAGLGNLKKSP